MKVIRKGGKYRKWTWRDYVKQKWWEILLLFVFVLGCFYIFDILKQVG